MAASLGLFDDLGSHGPTLGPLLGLVELVSLSDTFRTRCGVETDDLLASSKLVFGAAGSQKRIFYPVVDMRKFDVFPGAIIYPGSFDLTKGAGGDRNYLLGRGSLELTLVDEVRSERIEESIQLFLQWEGGVIQDIVNLFASEDLLAGSGVHLSMKPDTYVVEEGKLANFEYWGVRYNIVWEG